MTLALAAFDHGQRHPVLHRTARVELLALHEDVGSVGARQTPQANQRRAPDELDHAADGGWRDGRHEGSSPMSTILQAVMGSRPSRSASATSSSLSAPGFNHSSLTPLAFTSASSPRPMWGGT